MKKDDILRNTDNIEIYGTLALGQIPRILGLGDRDERSETFGCFDRYHWHYKLLDMPNARFQEVVLLLALLYKNRFQGNIFYKKEKTLEWAIGAIDYWVALSNKDGSVNEVYPNERSFCGTSFSTYAISEAIIILQLGKRYDLESMGNWLKRHNNLEVSNQVAGAILALQNIFSITGKEEYKKAAENKLEKLVSKQQETGVFPEYGGSDIGYHTLTLSCLAKYYKKTENRSLKGPLEKATRFCERAIRENGTYDYSDTSRKTQFIYPHGLAIMKSSVIERHVKGLRNNEVLSPAWMDDRYVIPLTVDYLQTFLEFKHDDDNGEIDSIKAL